jgi:hypothetical protein
MAEGLDAAVSRSNLRSGTPPNWPDIVREALAFVPNHGDRVVEVSRTGLHKSPDGQRLGADEAYLFLFPAHFVIAQMKGVFGKRVDVQGESYRGGNIAAMTSEELEYGSGGKTGEFAIQFYGAGRVPVARLAWIWFRKGFGRPEAVMLPAAQERDRIAEAIGRVWT